MRAFSPLSIQTWSTSEVPQAQRYDYYAHALGSAMFPIQVSRRPSQPFGVDMSVANLGGMTVVRQQGTPHRCFADKGNIECASQRNFHLLLNATSEWTMDHMGRQLLGPGDILLSDSAIPFSIGIDTDFDFVNVVLPEAWIRQWVPAPAMLVGRRISGNDGWGRALSAFLQGLAPVGLEGYPLPMSFIADHIGSLLALVAQANSTAPSKPPKRDEALLERIRDCMYQQASQADLTAADVAAAVGVSVRSLHRSFARFSTTFGDTLVGMRCAQAVRMLESPIFRRLTIAEIGRRAGFVDPSHFARVMHARTGRTPTLIRRQQPETPTSDHQEED